MNNSFSESYKAAGVDITAGYRSVELMKHDVLRTHTPGVLNGLGGFGGLFQLDLTGISEPVLVSGTDGVGTKLKLAMLLDRHDTIGIDAVAMCVNDIVCCGAKPLFFLDYIACGKNHPEKIAAIVKGVSEGCVQAGCALIGGETAEHPGLMPEEDYDIAGYSTGVVDKSKIITGETVGEGDVIIGLMSSGVHSNGFSLVRRVFDITTREALMQPLPGTSETLGDVLLTPTVIYVKPMLELIEKVAVKVVSHITGGGFYENIPRVLPEGYSARITKNSYDIPPIFKALQQTGNISERDMYNTFNMGIGMVCVVGREEADRAVGLLGECGAVAYCIGDIVKGGDGVVLL